MKFQITLFSFLLFSVAIAQNEQQQNMLLHFEDSLIELRGKMLKAKTSEERTKLNEVFTSTFRSVLSQGVSYDYGFDSVPSIGILRSPDNTFRIITWNLPFNDGTHEYYCFIQTKQKTKKRKAKSNDSFSLIQLIDKSASISNPEKKVLSTDKWYGALYYQIIPVKQRGKTYYILLGWDGNDKFVSKKIIDVMFFTGGQVKFGDSVFKESRGTKKRVIFEHSAEAVMSVKYDEKKKMIIFDHLSPLKEDLAGIKQYYVPDMSFDAFVLEKGKWVYQADVDIRNQGDIQLPYNDPKE